ncbi:MAG: hypothetical protein PHS06_01320 [Candidatus Shapirobacteria bacterium]|nr:hypothetical protein [Candidatus Shapirobacteria bacterium]
MKIKQIKKSVFEFSFKVIKKVKEVPFYLKFFVNKYFDNSLYFRTAKRIGNYNFLKLMYYEVFVKKFINPLKQMYYPSKVSLFVTLIASFIIFNIPWKNPDNFSLYLDSNHYQNFIAVHAAIGAMILAFLILIAETSDSGRNQDKARLILKETLLFPLATAEITSLVIYILGGRELGNTISVIVIAVLTIRAIYKIIQLFINRHFFQTKERELVNDRFSRIIDQSIMERIENNTLVEYFEQSKYEIDYSYFSTRRDGLKPILINKNGVLVDINLGRLEKLLYEIDKVANKYGMTIKKNTLKNKKPRNTSRVLDIKNEKNVPVGISVLKLIGQVFNEDNQKIFLIPKKIYEDKDLISIIDKEVLNIFKVKTRDDFEKEVRFELDQLKDNALDAIFNSRISVLGSIMSTYISLIENFLSVFKNYGDSYSHEDALKEMNSIFGGWSYLRWIKEDFNDVLCETIKSENFKLIKDVIHVPLEIAFKAFQRRDHLVFLEFIRFQSVLYLESKKVKDKDIKKYLIDRSSRYLKDFCDYRITPELENSEIKLVDIFHFQDFVFEILQTYKFIGKYSFDSRNIKVFEKYLNDVSNLMHRFEPSKDNRKFSIELQLKATKIDEKEKNELEDNLKKINELENIEEKINEKKKEYIYGFITWCLYKLEKINFGDQKLLRFWNILLPYLPKDLPNLIKINESCHSDRVENFWGWDWWELEEKRGDSNGVITSEILFDGKLDLLLIIMLFKIFKGKTEDQIDISHIQINRDQSVRISNSNGGFKDQINLIYNNKNIWGNILSTEELESKDVILSVLEKLVEKQKKEELDILIDTHIDQNKVNEFIDNFVGAYNERISIRRLLKIFGSYKKNNSIKKNKNYWGFNEIQDKEPFINSSYVDYSGVGEHYGEGLAENEDQIILNKIKDNSTEIVFKDIPLGEAIKTSILKLESNNSSPSIIFTTFYVGEWQKFNFSNSEFIPIYKIKSNRFKSIPNFIGLFKYGSKRIPVYQVLPSRRNLDKEIYVLNLFDFLDFEEYLPYSNAKDSKTMQLRDHFAFKVTDLGVEDTVRNGIIIKNPVWLQKYTDKDLYLKQKVIVNVKERFELNIKNKEASIKVIMKSSGSDED